METSLFENIAKKAYKEADKMEMDAGYAGYHNDGGASDFRDLIDAWECGLRGDVPLKLIKFLEIAEKSGGLP